MGARSPENARGRVQRWGREKKSLPFTTTSNPSTMLLASGPLRYYGVEENAGFNCLPSAKTEEL